MTDPTRDRRARSCRYAQIEGKPVLASWMGGADVAAGEAILREAGIPTFAYPDTAARAVQLHVALRRQPAALYETPALPDGAGARRRRARTSTGSSPRSPPRAGRS